MPTYLYGDSSPFPDGYDFLADLRAFVTASAEALRLGHEADELEQQLGERAQEHLHAIEALQSFFDGVTALVANRAARSGAPQLVGPYAREILEQVERIGGTAKQSRALHLDADQVEVTSGIRERRTQLRQVIASYLLTDPLPTLGWAMSLNLAGSVPHGQVVLHHPMELTTSFQVDVASDPNWGQGRRVGELCPGLTLQVGFKKAFLRSSLHPVVHTLDEFYLADLELGPDSMDLSLRRKPDATRIAYTLSLDTDAEGGITAKVTSHNDKRGGEESSAPFSLQGEHVQRIRELASQLRAECQPLLQRKRRLIFAQLEEHDIFERGLAAALIERLIARLAPIAEQVATHSPNPSELSLKIETDSGRREEIYLRKQELLDLVEPLPETQRELFRPLGFLPRKLSVPPAVPPLAVPT